MPIKVGDSMPALRLRSARGSVIREVDTQQLCRDRRVVLFGLPGAFTSTCSEIHLPGFVGHAAELLASGVDLIVCTSVNDIGVLIAWAEQHGVGDSITMLADGNGDLARALDLEYDGRKLGLGMRSQRYAAILEDGVVRYLGTDPPGQVTGSGAPAVLAALKPALA